MKGIAEPQAVFAVCNQGRKDLGHFFGDQPVLGPRVRLLAILGLVAEAPLLEEVEGMDGVLFGEDPSVALWQIGEQLRLWSSPTCQRTVANIAAAAGVMRTAQRL